MSKSKKAVVAKKETKKTRNYTHQGVNQASILGLLRKRKNKQAEVRELCKSFPGTPASNIFSAASRLVKRGLVTRIEGEFFTVKLAA